MKQFTAHFPATKKVWKGKTFETKAHSITYTQDDSGKWSSDILGSCLEMDLIEDCKKASNWKEIKAAYFPMVGFHS